MEPIIQEKINQMQLIQQNMQNFASQRQQFQLQQTEIESALAEMENTQKTYKIIGNIMVATNKDDLKRQLEEKKQMIDIRVASIEKQEAKLREKAELLQKDILAELEQKSSKKKKNDINKT